MLNEKVKIKATGRTGVVKAVLPDAQGIPWQIHVKLDGEVEDPYATPYVLALHEVTLLDVVRNN